MTHYIHVSYNTNRVVNHLRCLNALQNVVHTFSQVPNEHVRLLYNIHTLYTRNVSQGQRFASLGHTFSLEKIYWCQLYKKVQSFPESFPLLLTFAFTEVTTSDMRMSPRDRWRSKLGRRRNGSDSSSKQSLLTRGLLILCVVCWFRGVMRPCGDFTLSSFSSITLSWFGRRALWSWDRLLYSEVARLAEMWENRKYWSLGGGVGGSVTGNFT